MDAHKMLLWWSEKQSREEDHLERSGVAANSQIQEEKKRRNIKASPETGSRELYKGQSTYLSVKGTEAIEDKAWRHEERLFPWGVLGEARPKLQLKPSNERSLWGAAADKRLWRKNSHVSTSITPNPCLVHPLLWQGESQGEGEERGEKMMRGKAKRKTDEVKQREDKGKKD